jgi:hypothetical protein
MTRWYERGPGEIVHTSTEEPGVLLLAVDPPDWVGLPPELGGGKLRVLGAFEAECPMCKDGKMVRHVSVEHGYFVAECVTHGFIWYKRKAQEDDHAS